MHICLVNSVSFVTFLTAMCQVGYDLFYNFSIFQHPCTPDEPPVTLCESQVEIADDYTKRKNVFRVKTDNGSEFLLQADDHVLMQEWVTAIEETANIAAMAVVIVDQKDGGSGAHLQSHHGRQGIRKLTSFRNRSPSSHSPATKTRKASTNGMKMVSIESLWVGSMYTCQCQESCQ